MIICHKLLVLSWLYLGVYQSNSPKAKITFDLIISWAWNCLIVHVWQGLVLPSANYFWKIPRTAQNASKNDVALPSLRSQDDSSFTFLWVKLLTDFFPPVSSTQQRRHIHTQPTTKHWCILSYFLSGLIFTGCSSSETLILISITLKMWRCDLTVILHFFVHKIKTLPHSAWGQT